MNSSYLAERTLGYVQLTSLATSTPLTIPAGCSLIIIAPQTQAVRWRDDGVDPTAAIGYPLAVGSELRYTAKNMAQLRFIEQTASGAINVVFYGQG